MLKSDVSGDLSPKAIGRCSVHYLRLSHLQLPYVTQYHSPGDLYTTGMYLSLFWTPEVQNQGTGRHDVW